MLKRRDLPLNGLRAFEAVARHGVMRQAATELGVTHGALSRQIRLLEEQLALALFERAHNRLILTQAGKRLFATVRDALDRIAESTHSLDPQSMSGSLVVDTTPSMSVNWLIAVISEFCQLYPEVELQLRTIEPNQQRLTADFDVAICYGCPTEPAWPVRKLFSERFFPVASPEFLARAPTRQKPADLLSLPLLHDRHQHWPRWFQSLGITASQGNQNIHLHESFQVLLAARQGAGVALADNFEVARDLQSGGLVKLFDASIESTHSVYLLSPPEDRLNLKARLFIDFVDKWLLSVGSINSLKS